jgi:lysosomal acid lipase/cholesteryl ester hydrolase
LHLAKLCGLKFESQVVKTTDGFELSLHKVSLTEKANSDDPKGVVLLLHALMQSSDSFLLGGKTSLAYHLCVAGYEVYLGNVRGNKYSRVHEKFTRQEVCDYIYD